MFQRAEEVGLTKGNAIQFPFTQQHVADTLGMSLVHTNKTLRRLSATKAIRWKERRFEILDREALGQARQLRAAASRGRAGRSSESPARRVSRYVKFNSERGLSA